MIPKIVWQTHECEYDDLPELYKINSQTYQTFGWEYRYYSASDRQSFIAEHFPEYLHLYLHIGAGIYRADFWRYLVLYKYGGFFVDMDSRIFGDNDMDSDFFKTINDPDQTFHVLKASDTAYANGVILCSKENPVMKEIINTMVNKCQEFYDEGWKIFPHFGWIHATGPEMYTNVINKNLDQITHWYIYDLDMNKLPIKHGGPLKHKIDVDAAKNLHLGER